MSEVTILGIGELLWDQFPDGRRPGGAPFNFAFHCRQLGHPSAIVSRVGSDPLGQELLNLVRTLGMSDSLIDADNQHATGTVEVHITDGQPDYQITEHVAWDFLECSPRLERAAKEAKVLCFGTLAQRHSNSRATIRQLCEIASGLIVCDVNLRQGYYNREIVEASFISSHWLKLNDTELSTLGELLDLSSADPIGELRVRYQLDLVCVTRGANGCRIETVDITIDEPGLRVQVHDTVGAGDAFTAGLVCGHLEGLTLEQSARLANRLAARVASMPGGTPSIERQQIDVD